MASIWRKKIFFHEKIGRKSVIKSLNFDGFKKTLRSSLENVIRKLQLKFGVDWLKIGGARGTPVSKNLILRKTRLKFQVLKNHGNLLFTFNRRCLGYTIDFPNEDQGSKIEDWKSKIYKVLLPHNYDVFVVFELDLSLTQHKSCNSSIIWVLSVRKTITIFCCLLVITTTFSQRE